MSVPKQLVWEHTTNEPQYQDVNFWIATTPFWDYKIKKSSSGKYLSWNQDGERFDTLEEAQEWFQKEVWEPLVMACLTDGATDEIS